MTGPMLRVELTPDEMDRAITEGERRLSFAEAEGMARKYDQGVDAVRENSIDGAVGELAAAKALGLDWTAEGPGPDKVGGPDLISPAGRTIEVRHARPLHFRLIIHPDDAEDVGLLVVGVPPVLFLAGWCWLQEFKLRRYWRTSLRHPCFMIPQDQLKKFTNQSTEGNER